MWSSAIGAPQRKRVAIGKTVTTSKLPTNLMNAIATDVANTAFMATVSCRLSNQFRPSPAFKVADSLHLDPVDLPELGDPLIGCARLLKQTPI